MGHGFKISKKRKSKKDDSINTQKLILSNLKPLTNNIGDKLMSCPKNSSIIISDGSCTLFFNTYTYIKYQLNKNIKKINRKNNK